MISRAPPTYFSKLKRTCWANLKTAILADGETRLWDYLLRSEAVAMKMPSAPFDDAFRTQVLVTPSVYQSQYNVRLPEPGPPRSLCRSPSS